MCIAQRGETHQAWIAHVCIAQRAYQLSVCVKPGLHTCFTRGAWEEMLKLRGGELLKSDASFHVRMVSRDSPVGSLPVLLRLILPPHPIPTV